MSFHSGVTSRESDYAPLDTGVSNLQLVALERLPSIERAAEILIDLTFLRGTKAPLKGELAAARLTERWMQICCNLSVSASPSHLPFQGRLWTCALYGFPYEGKLSPEATDEVNTVSLTQVPPPHPSRLRRATFPS